jgi:hypothetical protein
MDISIKDYTNITDLEKSKYLLLSKLKECEKYFNDSKIYPTFYKLIAFYDSIYDLLSNREKIYNREYGDDEEANKLAGYNEDIEKTFTLMEWSIPHIVEVIESGRTLYDFVEDNLNIESIGINSSHNLQGYIIVPDNRNKTLHIIKYEQNLHNCLKSKEVGNYKWNMIVIPKSVLKNYIIAEDIMNQIIYYMDTELTFPYSETILPVAKRKFLHYLQSR